MKISQEQFRYVMKAVRDTERHHLTWAVWSVALTYMRFDTGEVLATRTQLANDAAIAADEVSRAMSALVHIGAIIRERRGQHIVYFVNPNVGWNGNEGSRQAAAKSAPKLRLVSDRTSGIPTS